jgi:hypothetical protein
MEEANAGIIDKQMASHGLSHHALQWTMMPHLKAELLGPHRRRQR